MVRIQLENGYLDVKEGTVFPLNFGVSDVRDLTARSGVYSKTITLIGTANNHNLLNHYYDVNVVAGTFDINALTPCAVIQDGLPIVEDAYLQLIAVNKVQRDNGYEEDVEYEVLIKDVQSDFFTKIDQAELTDLDFSEFNHTYSSANVTASFNNTVTDGYVYPMGQSPDNVYVLQDFKPAIYVKQYWDKIHQYAGYSYEWTTLQDAYFDKLIIPFNGDTVYQDYTDYIVNATRNTDITFTQAAGVHVTSQSGTLTGWTENVDVQALFNPTTGVYDVPFYINSGQSLSFTFDFSFNFDLINGTGSTAYLVDMASSPATRKYFYRPFIQVKNQSNVVVATWQPLAINTFEFAEGSLATGQTTIGTFDQTINIAATNLSPTDTLTIEVGILVQSNGNVRWKDTNSPLGTDVQIDYEIDFGTFNVIVTPSQDLLEYTSTINLNSFVPKQVKMKDFVKSLCTMFNLYVEKDKDNPNKLIYRHRDDYYDSGIEKNWTYKLAKDRDQVLQFLPELSAKKLVLSYKDDSDQANKLYLDNVKETYGQVEFTFDNEYVRGIDRKELIFAPTPMGVTTFNAVVPILDLGAPKSALRILIHSGVQTCDAFNIYDIGTTGQTNEVSYPSISHFNDHYNPTFDINFGVCDYYFYDGITLTNNNLFNTYWRRTIGQINAGKMLTAYFDLNEGDIRDLELNDKIRIDNSWWNINKVIDYDANSDALTKVELMSVDSELDFATFINKPLIPLTPPARKKPLFESLRSVIERRNVNMSPESVVVKGIGNVVNEGLKGYVEGEYKIVSEDGVWVDSINGYTVEALNENFANADLTFDGNRTHDTNGFDLNISTDGGVNAQSNILLSQTSANWLFGLKGVLVDVDGTFIKGSQINSYRSANATTTLDLSEYIVECTANTFTINLPTAANPTGLTYVIKNSGTGVITIDPNGTETIDGNTTITLIQYESVTLVSNGANWIII